MSLLNLAGLESEPIASSSISSASGLVSPIRSDVLDLRTLIHRHIYFVLNLNRGNKLKTARQLGISRSTLYRMLDAEFSSRP